MAFVLRGLRVPEPQDAPDVGDSGHKIYATEEKNTHNTLGGRRRPHKEPAPPHRRGHAHRRPLQHRRRAHMYPPPPMQMTVVPVVPRRRVRKEVQHVDHRRAPHVIARRPRQIIKYMSHRFM